MMPAEKLLLILRDVQAAHDALATAIRSLDVQPPSLYHSALLSLNAKRGVLQAAADRLAKEPRLAAASS
jgi:hypothetical protein